MFRRLRAARAHAERLALELAEERKQRAILQQQVQWLTAALNTSNGERALLLQKAIGVAVPIAEVVATAPASVPLANVAGKPMADVTPGIDIGALMLGAAAFEDMGDDQAEREGVGPAPVAVQLR